MTAYAAFLRGINVGGNKRVRMDCLMQALEAIGLTGIRTYIQSGNLLFSSDTEEESLRRKIENRMEEVFGFTAAVVLRTTADLENVIQNCPFPDADDAVNLYVCFFARVPSPETMSRIYSYKSEDEDCRLLGRELYIDFCHSFHDSKLAGKLSSLDVITTVRNWNTVCKMNELAKV